jgi:hypothetical protein
METTPEWRRPRVGQRVKLRGGKVVEVVTVRTCNNILRLLTEDRAMVLGSKLRATYGHDWQKVYYEAEAMVKGRPVVFRPNDVVEILDTRI